MVVDCSRANGYLFNCISRLPELEQEEFHQGDSLSL